MTFTRRHFMAGAAGLAGAAALGGRALADGTLAQLEADAKAEGGTVVYYTNIADAQPLFNDALKQRYPWMNVQVFGGSSNGDIRTKFKTEIQAGLGGADVMIASLADFKPFKALNAMAEVTLPEDANMPKDLMVFAPQMHPLWQVLFVLDYNADAGVEPPGDVFELADPKWKDKIAFDRPVNASAAGIFIASRRQLWGDEKWNQWLTGLQANNISITGSANTTYSQILQGDRQIGVDGLQDTLNQPAGAPVKVNFYDHLVTAQQFGVISRLAPHPKAAALYINWLMSEEGQQVFAKSGRIPVANIDSPMSVSHLVPAGTQLMSEPSLTDWVENTSTYLDKYKQLWPQ